MAKTNNSINFGATTNTQLIIGSNTAGPNALGVIGNAAFGTYASITAPSNGLIISGIVGCGTSAPNQSSQLDVSTTNAYGIYVNGTQTSLSGNSEFAIVAAGTLNPAAPTTTSMIAGFGALSAIVAPTGTTITTAAGFYSNLTLNTNSGTITNACGAYIDVGTAITGTVTNAFGLYVNTPTGGTNKYTAVFTGSNTTLVGIATKTPVNSLDVSGSAAIGTYAGVTTAPSDGLIVSGLVGCGTATPNTNAELNVFTTNAYGIYVNGTQTSLDGANNEFSVIAAGTLKPTAPTTTSMIASFGALSAIVAPTGTTITTAAGFYSNLTLNTNSGTITNACGAYIDVGTAITGTVTNAFGLYVNTPTGGTNKYTAVFTGSNTTLVGIATKTPVNSLDVSGSAAIGTYAGVNAAPADSLIVSGAIGIATTGPSGFLDVAGSATNSGAIYGTLLRSNLTETGVSTGTAGLFIGGTHTINSTGTGSNGVTFLEIFPNAIGTTTVNNFMGMLISAGIGSGIINNAYGLYVSAPSVGTTAAALYCDNATIGYAGVTPPTNGLIAAGKVGIGNNAPAGILDVQGTVSSTSPYGVLLRPNLTATGSNAPATGVFVGGTQTINGSGTNNSTFLGIYPDLVATTTAANLYGLYVGGAIASGTVTDAYGAYITAPGVGINAAALYADNMSIGYTAMTPSTNGLNVKGQVGIANATPTTPLNVGTGGVTMLIGSPSLISAVSATAACISVSWESGGVSAVEGLYYADISGVRLGSVSYSNCILQTNNLPALSIDITQQVQFTSTNSFALAGATAATATLGRVPDDAQTTTQEWLVIADNEGTLRYIPCF